MKKKLLSLLTCVLCVTACTSLFAACGDSSQTQPTTNGDGNQLEEAVSHEVSDEQWSGAFNAANNFTLTPYVDDEQEDGLKADVDKVQMGDSVIMAKVADKYYRYINLQNSWNKTEITEEEYLQSVEGIFQTITVWKDTKAAFTFADGIYSAASVQFGDSNTVTDVKIVFENGNLISVEFTTTQYDGEPVRNVLHDIGTTAITLPTV